uniref:Uncharacterized protein n=1 Tax=Leptocylindrus danicus TaxID=163516 RepID=A0A7S2PDF8_9STRA|mmetsp:Transcript_28947/g.42516  ORF Transcript_28947/g.42516 Transcript_28947/m.42516 type:complete len:151 (+) Transcript_28947:152-604(+)
MNTPTYFAPMTPESSTSYSYSTPVMPAPPRAGCVTAADHAHQHIIDSCLVLPDLDQDDFIGNESSSRMIHMSPLKMRRRLAPRLRPRGVQVVPAYDEQINGIFASTTSHCAPAASSFEECNCEDASPLTPLKRLVFSDASEHFAASSIPQ